MKAILFALSLILSLSACATGERMGWLKEGMSPEQVTDTIGAPTGQQRQGDVLVYSYADRMISGWAWNRTDFYTAFEGDKLVAWGQYGDVRSNQPNIGTVLLLGPMAPYRQTNTVVIQQQPASMGTYQPSYYP